MHCCLASPIRSQMASVLPLKSEAILSTENQQKKIHKILVLRAVWKEKSFFFINRADFSAKGQLIGGHRRCTLCTAYTLCIQLNVENIGKAACGNTDGWHRRWPDGTESVPLICYWVLVRVLPSITNGISVRKLD